MPARGGDGDFVRTFAGGLSPAQQAAFLPDAWSPLAVGEEVLPRDIVVNDFGLDTGTVFFSYFTARKTEAITKVQTGTASTAGATLTIARVGIYTASGGTLTLINSSVNDTTMWTAAFTAYQKALSSTFNKVAGTRYAVGLLAIGSTMPVLECNQIRFLSAASAPRLSGELAGQANLPASQLESGLTVGSRRFQAILLP
jgi:hypothetical protein